MRHRRRTQRPGTDTDDDTRADSNLQQRGMVTWHALPASTLRPNLPFARVCMLHARLNGGDCLGASPPNTLPFTLLPSLSLSRCLQKPSVRGYSWLHVLKERHSRRPTKEPGRTCEHSESTHPGQSHTGSQRPPAGPPPSSACASAM